MLSSLLLFTHNNNIVCAQQQLRSFYSLSNLCVCVFVVYAANIPRNIRSISHSNLIASVEAKHDTQRVEFFVYSDFGNC